MSNRSSPSRVRFAASRPGRLRADPKNALLTRGKEGSGSDSYFVSYLIAFDSIEPRLKSGVFGPCGRAEREPFGHTWTPKPQPWGAVTRRAVAQRRSRASGLTRPLAEAIKAGQRKPDEPMLFNSKIHRSALRRGSLSSGNALSRLEGTGFFLPAVQTRQPTASLSDLVSVIER